MEDERDAKAAIRGLDRMEFGYKRRPLRVEWAKKMEVAGKNQAPTTTLFVVNFDVRGTRESDIERHFERYGTLNRVEIKRNYAFVEFKTIEDATHAQKQCHGTTLNGRTITVEFVEARGDKDRSRDRSRSPYGGGRRNSVSPRGRGRSPPIRRGGYSPRKRSPSPPRRMRSRSPDYTRGGGRGGRGGSRSRSRSPGRGRSPRRY
eukprot:GHRR01005714.1.p1 GENE.GHRR01005714.1~~GHRR01005714.1.p1  ORF type:complete len:204 (+),score=45.54 GHRR01005714.1:725-1336(+)